MNMDEYVFILISAHNLKTSASMFLQMIYFRLSSNSDYMYSSKWCKKHEMVKSQTAWWRVVTSTFQVVWCWDTRWGEGVACTKWRWQLK